jgi:hypothetical protein
MESLASAFNARRYSKAIKCAHGGPLHCSEGCYAQGGEVKPSEGSEEIVKAILAKKMPKEEPMMDDDLDLDLDLDEMAEEEPEAPVEDRKETIAKILSGIRSRQVEE